MHCPKCHGEMMEVRKEHVHIDVCRQCGGVFLDRGELESLLYGTPDYDDLFKHKHKHHKHTSLSHVLKDLFD